MDTVDALAYVLWLLLHAVMEVLVAVDEAGVRLPAPHVGHQRSLAPRDRTASLKTPGGLLTTDACREGGQTAQVLPTTNVPLICRALAVVLNF